MHNFLIETKADLLLSHGFTNEAKQFYEKVLENESNNIYVKKQLFNIEYENYEKNIIQNNQKIFNFYSDLMWNFQNDILLQKKFKNLAFYIKKNDWVNFAEANIYIINSRNIEAMQKYNDIISSSNDKKLKNYARKKLNAITNE